MKTLILLFLSICVLSCKTNQSQDATSQKPNIIYINTDDLGYKDTAVYGSTFYETPNIDSLAKSGIVFTHGYAGAANCAPSRACLLSGMNTPKHGIYTVGTSERGDTRLRKLIPTVNTEILADSIVTMAEMLKSAGYSTATFGKWHLGKDPRTQGFDINVGGGLNGSPGRGGYFSPWSVPALEDGPEGENLTDRLTSEVLSYLKSYKSGKPFFIYLPFYAVHQPLMTFPELEEKYTSKKGNELQNNATYAGMVETTDTNIGKLLTYLKKTGLDQNTLVIFTSDNGGIRKISNQDPLRAGKGSYYEGGIRVPFIFSWPGHIKPGSTTDTPITNLDIYPTLLEITQANTAGKMLDGNSILPVLKGKTIAQRPLYFHFPIYLQAYSEQSDQGRDPLFRTRPGSVLIEGDWKLHQYFEDGGLELYNLKSDPGENKNLAEAYPEKTNTLLQNLKVWRNQVKAPIPTVKNPDYDVKFERKRIEKVLRE